MRWSPQMLGLIGRDPVAALSAGHNALWRRALHPDDRKTVTAAVRACSRNLGPFALEFRILRPDGDIRWIDARGNVLPDACGNPRHIVGVNIDITERKLAEAALEQRVAKRTKALREMVEALRASRERYGAILEHAPIYLAFMRVEADGRLVCEDVNDAWLRDTGFTREQVVGRTLEEIFSPEQAAFGLAQYRKVIETGEPVEYEYRHAFPAGEVIRRSFLAPLHDAAGRVKRVLLTSMDLTAMRRVEEQLRQAQKMEAIGQLTGGIAHDFNNLLTVVLGNLELLQPRLHDERSMRHLGAAQRAARRGGELTHQLLAYARRQNISPKPVDLTDMIGGMGDLLQRSLGGLVRVETTLDTDLWPAFCDPTQLEMMLLNLAINARDAMPDGGVIGIAARNVPNGGKLPPELAPNDYVTIAVIDSGTGMSPDVRDHAFEPFFTTKEPGKGSGLGLAQVWGLAQQFGGTVLLDSTFGRGTTVRVFLPRATEPVAAAPTPSIQRDAWLPAGRVVLVVDDDDDARDVAAAFLEEDGYVVRRAASWTAGIGLLAAWRRCARPGGLRDARHVGHRIHATRATAMPGAAGGIRHRQSRRTRRPGADRRSGAEQALHARRPRRLNSARLAGLSRSLSPLPGRRYTSATHAPAQPGPGRDNHDRGLYLRLHPHPDRSLRRRIARRAHRRPCGASDQGADGTQCASRLAGTG